MTFASPTNLTGIDSMILYVDAITGGVFSIGMLFAMYVIIVIFLKNKEYMLSDCMTSAGFITSITAILLFFMGIIAGPILFFPIGLTMLSAAIGRLVKDY